MRRKIYARTYAIQMDARKAWAIRNPEKMRAASNAWKHRNKTEVLRKQREDRQSNRDHYLAQQKKYRQALMADPVRRENKNKKTRAWKAMNGNMRHENAARRAARIQATPSWGQDGISDVYQEAEYQQMHVDHIIPLRSKLVCGLHVWDNLQLLTAQANMKKGNKFTPLTL